MIISQYILTEREPDNLLEPWLLVVVLSALLLIAWVRVNYPRRMKGLFQNLVNIRLLRQELREELVLSHRASLALSFLFLLLFPALIYLSFKAGGISSVRSGYELYLSIFIFIILVYTLKILSIRVIQWAGNDDFTLNEYIYQVFLSSKIFALLVFPLILFALFTSAQVASKILAVGLVLFGLTYLYRVGRSTLTALQSRIEPLYIILYLCALEILPLLILWRLLAD